MQGVVARVMARAVASVMCLGSIRRHHARGRDTRHGTSGGMLTSLGSARGHHARGCGTRHGMSGGMCHVSLLGPWAPCKGLWHASGHRRWHVSRVLARLVGTMQGVMTRIMEWVLACVTCLGSICGHHARACGMCHGAGGGMSHVSWLGPWNYARARGMCHGTGSGMYSLSWLDPWHHARAHGTCHSTGVDPHFSRASPLDRRDSLFYLFVKIWFLKKKVGAATYFIFIFEGKIKQEIKP